MKRMISTLFALCLLVIISSCSLDLFFFPERANVVGTWVFDGDLNDKYTFREDGTFERRYIQR